MVSRSNDLGTLKIFLHISRYSVAFSVVVAVLVQLLVESVQQLVAMVDELVLLVGVPVLVLSANVVKAHLLFQDFLANS